jgi:hypothetical protein
MKYCLHLFSLLLLCLICTALSAQDNWEETIYLKNGSIYRGTVIEQIPGVSLNIETRDRNVIHINMADVERMTKTRIEPPIAPPPPPAPPRDMDYHDREMHHSGEGHHDRLDEAHHRPYYQAKRGYFGQASLDIGTLQIGVRTVHGFRFNRFAQLGAGIGVDAYIGGQIGKGLYAPVFLHFTGDVLQTRITPFYAIEAGYGFRLGNGSNADFSSKFEGGLMGGIGFGVKFQSKQRFNFRLSAVVNVQSDNTKYSYSNKSLAASAGVRLGFGF